MFMRAYGRYMPAPPIPAITRPRIITSVVGTAPQMVLPTSNVMMLAMMNFLNSSILTILTIDTHLRAPRAIIYTKIYTLLRFSASFFGFKTLISDKTRFKRRHFMHFIYRTWSYALVITVVRATILSAMPTSRWCL